MAKGPSRAEQSGDWADLCTYLMAEFGVAALEFSVRNPNGQTVVTIVQAVVDVLPELSAKFVRV